MLITVLKAAEKICLNEYNHRHLYWSVGLETPAERRSKNLSITTKLPAGLKHMTEALRVGLNQGKRNHKLAAFCRGVSNMSKCRLMSLVRAIVFPSWPLIGPAGVRLRRRG